VRGTRLCRWDLNPGRVTPGRRSTSAPGKDAPDSDFRLLCRAAFHGTLSDDAFDTPLGILYRAVVELDFALQKRFSVTLGEVTRTEFLALRVFEEEKIKYQEYRMKLEAGTPTPKWNNVDR
jgi:hypothetical protein